MRAYGDQNMTWQALRDVARGQSRYWPDGQVNAVYPNGDGARTSGPAPARYPEWLWRYFTSTGDHTTLLALYPSVTRAVDWLWSTRQAGTGLLYGLADTDDGDPVYGYDLSVAADTASNVLAVNAMGRVAQIATVAGDTAAAATWQTRASQLGAAVNGVLRRADGMYVDGVDANGAQSHHASQEANALALAYGVVPASKVAVVGRYVASLGIDVGPNHGLELLPRAGGGEHAGGDGAPPHRHVHPGVGPHCGGRWDLHLGGLETERPHRGFPLPRLGVLRAGGDAGDPARGDAAAAQRGRGGQRAGRAPVGRPRPRRGFRADRSPVRCTCPGSARARA